MDIITSYSGFQAERERLRNSEQLNIALFESLEKVLEDVRDGYFPRLQVLYLTTGIGSMDFFDSPNLPQYAQLRDSVTLEVAFLGPQPLGRRPQGLIRLLADAKLARQIAIKSWPEAWQDDLFGKIADSQSPPTHVHTSTRIHPVRSPGFIRMLGIIHAARYTCGDGNAGWTGVQRAIANSTTLQSLYIDEITHPDHFPAELPMGMSDVFLRIRPFIDTEVQLNEACGKMFQSASHLHVLDISQTDRRFESTYLLPTLTQHAMHLRQIRTLDFSSNPIRGFTAFARDHLFSSSSSEPASASSSGSGGGMVRMPSESKLRVLSYYDPVLTGREAAFLDLVRADGFSLTKLKIAAPLGFGSINIPNVLRTIRDQTALRVVEFQKRYGDGDILDFYMANAVDRFTRALASNWFGTIIHLLSIRRRPDIIASDSLVAKVQWEYLIVSIAETLGWPRMDLHIRTGAAWRGGMEGGDA